jgi:LPS-assembly lipoprotein
MPVCWGKEIGIPRRLMPRQFMSVAVVFALGVLTAACFQPEYGDHTLVGGDSVRDKLATVEVVNIPAGKGAPEARLAVSLRNQLMYDFNGGESAAAPLYRLQITGLVSGIQTVIVDVASGRPDTQVSAVNASFTLTEIATGKVVLTSSTFGRASFDIPGSAQRFAQQRAWLNAEDRAVAMIADNIKNRLASFFVAAT